MERDRFRTNLGGHRFGVRISRRGGRAISRRIGLREMEHGRSGRGLTVTDAGLALNGLTGIQPLTITIVAIIGPPRLVSRWPPFLSLPLAPPPRFSLSLLPPRSFTLFFSTANYYRHSSFFQRLLPPRPVAASSAIQGHTGKYVKIEPPCAPVPRYRSAGWIGYTLVAGKLIKFDKILRTILDAFSI